MLTNLSRSIYPNISKRSWKYWKSALWCIGCDLGWNTGCSEWEAMMGRGNPGIRNSWRTDQEGKATWNESQHTGGHKAVKLHTFTVWSTPFWEYMVFITGCTFFLPVQDRFMPNLVSNWLIGISFTNLPNQQITYESAYNVHISKVMLGSES